MSDRKCPTDDPLEPRDPLLEAVARTLRRPVDLGSGVDARVLAQLRAERSRAGRRRFSPLVVLATAAAVAGVTLLGVGLARRGWVDEDVRFRLVEPAASRVAVVGDFNDWNPAAAPLERGASGAWSATIPLPPGRYRYTFVVDGDRWVSDPTEPPAPDDFGTPTSVITVARR